MTQMLLKKSKIITKGAIAKLAWPLAVLKH